jgi:hypothetical protein
MVLADKIDGHTSGAILSEHSCAQDCPHLRRAGKTDRLRHFRTSGLDTKWYDGSLKNADGFADGEAEIQCVWGGS